MTRVQIRSFRPTDWELYRDVRLAALQESPDAFGSTYALNSTFDDDVWRSRLEGLAPDADFPLVATINGIVGGMAWVRIAPDEPDTAHLFQMWVAPEFRGQGVAREMLHAAIEWAGHNEARTTELAVTRGASPARRLYESIGFEPTCEPEPLREGSALRVQPMVLALADGTRQAAGPGPPS
ncbi:MAG: GNAT family N-acetyltransferase [Gammaproteobacteria bacterium]|nr:GNAT family N-acetyltransferase [Gammaproteobacteria bacterium]